MHLKQSLMCSSNWDENLKEVMLYKRTEIVY